MIKFPDISFYQLKVDFDVLKTKTDYVILRSGQGEWIDNQFRRNRDESKRVGLPWGTYWFYDDRQSPDSQSTLLCNLLKETDNKPSEIWCDWERSYDGKYSNLKNVVLFMKAVEKSFGMQVGMYTGYFWWTEQTNPVTNSTEYKWLKNRKLWLANYNPKPLVLIPKPWITWNNVAIWQFGTPPVGHEYGVATEEIDMNERIDSILDNRLELSAMYDKKIEYEEKL